MSFATTAERMRFLRPSLFLDSDQAIVVAIARIADAGGVSMARIALAWILRKPHTPREPTYF
jgi:aryl-alcohol dehydrogenase-like predicted oxidoreductase